MKTTMEATRRFSNEPPSRFRCNDNRLSEDLLEQLIADMSRPGDRIFDPFAGFATTLLVAGRQGRVGYGVERIQDRCEFARSLLASPDRLVQGDIREVDLTSLPVFDLSISSPVYMHREEATNPLSSHRGRGSYARYLADLVQIYSLVADRIRRGGRLVTHAQSSATPFFATTAVAALALLEIGPLFLRRAALPRRPRL